jgi:acetyl esterase/lipase
MQPPLTFNQLVVVGHSLGAGAAAVLGLLLKNEYPTVKVFGYG